jgi:hypothetical protein
MLQACPTYNHFATHEYLLDRYFDANADGHDLCERPLLADCVEKLENGAAPKISQMSLTGDFSR